MFDDLIVKKRPFTDSLKSSPLSWPCRSLARSLRIFHTQLWENSVGSTGIHRICCHCGCGCNTANWSPLFGEMFGFVSYFLPCFAPFFRPWLSRLNFNGHGNGLESRTSCCGSLITSLVGTATLSCAHKLTTLLAATSPAVRLRKILLGVTGRKRPRAMPLWKVDGRLEEKNKQCSSAVAE